MNLINKSNLIITSLKAGYDYVASTFPHYFNDDSSVHHLVNNCQQQESKADIPVLSNLILFLKTGIQQKPYQHILHRSHTITYNYHARGGDRRGGHGTDC